MHNRWGPMPLLAAQATERSKNTKLGHYVSTTYAGQQSCPDDCPFRGQGCYAEVGLMQFITSRANLAATNHAPEDIARIEAEAIRNLSGWYPLRLHTVGDCKTNEAAKIVSDACEGHKAPVWTYTHAWRHVERKNWQSVSALASCENIHGVTQAHEKGYATAMVVDKFQQEKAYPLENGFTGIPCPEMTRGRTCQQCRLCWNDKRLRENKLVILFEAHSQNKDRVLKVLGQQ